LGEGYAGGLGGAEKKKAQQVDCSRRNGGTERGTIEECSGRGEKEKKLSDRLLVPKKERKQQGGREFGKGKAG